MKKISMAILITMVAVIIVTLTACKDKTLIYTAEEYDSAISRIEALTKELDESHEKESKNTVQYNSHISDMEKELRDLNESLEESRTKEEEYERIIAEKDEMIREMNEAFAEEDNVQTEGSSATAGKVETERKFLLDINNLPWDLMNLGIKYEFVQTYLNYSPEMRIRARTGYRNDFYMTIKIPLDNTGLSRQEIEFFISEDEYNELLKKKVDNTIFKTRYEFWVNGHYVAVDIYKEDLAGLAVSEVAFKSVEAANAYNPPEWFGKDVTSDKRFKNASLAKNGLPDY